MTDHQQIEPDTKLILITNDDGINAPGIWALAEAVRDLGEVWIVAPDRERSGVSNAFTLMTPLRYFHQPRNGFENVYAVTGTPVDAAKFALHGLMPKMPDLVFSGINRGENTGINLLYSGTVAGAMEGAIIGIPSIAVSIVWPKHSDKSTEYSLASSFARRLAERVLEEGLPFGTMLNVNVPNIPESDLKGILITPQAESHYEEIIDKRSDPRGNEYFWISGVNKLIDENADSDMKAVREKYIAVTPVCARLTNEGFLKELKGWNL